MAAELNIALVVRDDTKKPAARTETRVGFRAVGDYLIPGSTSDRHRIIRNNLHGHAIGRSMDYFAITDVHTYVSGAGVITNNISGLQSIQGNRSATG